MTRVMVVDDSAVVRQVLSSVLNDAGGFEVVTAADGVFALDKVGRVKPDVVVLDLEMPRMHGLEVLKILSQDLGIPVVICSAITGEGTTLAMRAMDAGAIEVIAKPKLQLDSIRGDTGQLLVDIVRSASKAKVKKRKKTVPAVPLQATPKLTADAVLAPRATRGLQGLERVVAIGASTGGTEALQEIFLSLTKDCPPIVVVQHMPAGFTRAFAERLDQCCEPTIQEASNGDEVVAGRVLIAPGDQHMMLYRRGGRLLVELREGPLVSRHRPSVDVLFRSVAQTVGKQALGIIMTGMGSDGAQGLLEMREAGATTIAQDEESCVVFGMPKEAVVKGGVERVVPLERIGREIQKFQDEATRKGF